MIILLHTSKTMKPKNTSSELSSKPALGQDAEFLMGILTSMSPLQVSRLMKIKPQLAEKVCAMHADWSLAPGQQSTAVEAFVGDIYSGLQVSKWNSSDRAYAQAHLRILSGLYGVLRPYDMIMPYRLEMGYPLKAGKFKNLYQFWSTKIAESIPESKIIVNLSAVEYTKAVLPFIEHSVVITPKFLTVSPKTGEPVFVVVHAKIARGAFASWLIQSKAENDSDLTAFKELGYEYSAEMSTASEPVFVCQEFGGVGLSIRLA